MACLIVGTFVERRSEARLPVLTVMTIHVSVGAAALIVLAVATGALVPPTDPEFWLAALLSAALPTLVAYGLYWWLLRRVGITALNALLFLVAPTTALAGTAMFGEPLTGWTIVGFVLCASGVALVLIFDRARRPVAAPATAPAEKIDTRLNDPRLAVVSPSTSVVRPDHAPREAEEACRR